MFGMTLWRLVNAYIYNICRYALVHVPIWQVSTHTLSLLNSLDIKIFEIFSNKRYRNTEY